MIGSKLAHYEITALVGKGGMGEVYRARDTKLGRDVALKILPEEFAQDRERLARFRREARTLASLNHAHIAAIHDIDEAEGKVFLTMELVEGQDLSDRLRQGPVPVAEAIELARQLAEGLREAHQKGVVHRDLKPANVKITPDAQLKILDFGLARAWHGDEETEDDLQNSPTITAAMTQQGVILGTAAYMSPEQARGRSVDQRADIFAFGAIVWEMLTGKQLFEGESISDTLAAVLRAEPDEAELPADTPSAVRRMLRHCLERDRRRRLQHIGDARLFLEGELSAEPPKTEGSTTAGPWRWATIALGALSVALAVFAFWPGTESSSEQPRTLRRWSFTPPAEDGLGEDMAPAIAPDGQRLAYASDGRIWVRDLRELEPRPLDSAAGGTLPFWSPDGQWLGFARERRIWKVPAGGGQATPIGAIAGSQPGSSSSVSWDEEDRIVMGTGVSGLLHVPTAGASTELFVPTGDEDSDFHEVAAIPGGRGWVFVVHENTGGFGRLDLYTPDGERRMLLDLESDAVFTPFVTASGYILFRRSGLNAGIWAMRFSLERLEVDGAPFLVAANGSRPTVSNDGTLVYQLGGGQVPGQMVWLDREGRVESTLGDVETSRPFPLLSADGRDFLLTVSEEQGRDIWSFDATTGQGRRLDSTEMSEEIAVRSPDGKFVYMYAASDEGSTIYRYPTNVPSEIEPVVAGIMAHPRPDLGLLYYARQKPNQFDFDVAVISLEPEADEEPRILVENDGIVWWPMVSPDGRFLLFNSNESGQYEVYLTELPDARGRWKVSSDGGQMPYWRADGTEIFYSEQESIYSVSFESEAGVQLGNPRKLFSYDSTRWSSDWESGFSVDPTGERFLVVRRRDTEESSSPEIVVVEHWETELEER